MEGDAKLYDQTVREAFVNLYFSTMTMHYDQTDPDAQMIEEVLKFLLKNMITRVTQLFGDVWGIVTGGVPSGAFNTSHMDSWIMALYFCLFCVWQINQAPIEVQEELESHFFLYIRLIVYGDDHLYNKGEGVSAQYFGGQAFADFMKKHFDVTIRDLKDGIPFCSTTTPDGFVRKMGATFLRHQFVLNPSIKKDQPWCLPFRETREYMIRAVHGRETKSRDQIDVLLSVVGHVYGTYASNPDAYERLAIFYSELVSSIVDNLADLPKLMRSRMTELDLKKIRQTNLTTDDICNGFPTWDTLVDKNRYDSHYQDISQIPLDFDSDISGLDDVF